MRRLLALLSGFALVAALFPASAAAAQPSTPVVFVHGFSGKGDQWDEMRGTLADSGYPEELLSAFDYDWARSNTTIAEGLGDHVDDLLDEHGAERVHMVTHSMGGLSSRYYIQNLGGTDTVDQWISIGGPNNGTNIANLCPSPITPCEEMRHDSDFLNDLNEDPTPGPVDYTTMRSPCDAVISPVDSTSLPGAENIETGCIGHIGMMSDDEVIDLVGDIVL
ncbi:alpha/beta fold hydrolase [Nocardiopsis sp. HNM0947]|uniref:Alpha/beta fold hydrolase n=1 Tax=Nocardiopsis coralli TaxID=2772213 RepID=A0ABR9P2N0_9ACTN|nr:alpha/beta fold hydrolase [Nocardiopsis coralli]MBE2998097.1 alpha/beta fold hydrolase [Nocardiopsis coralli]